MSRPEPVGAQPGPLLYRCEHCGITAASKVLSVCQGCKVTQYCSREHQVEHRSKHKATCTKIKKARAKLEAEDGKIRYNPNPTFMSYEKPFETAVGHFWGILDTRDYMRARFALADILRKTQTRGGVSEALDHFKDMLRLCRSDNMGVRDFVPPLMLQLDQDQNCYDFIKWWFTSDLRGDYDWGNMELPYLNLEGEDAREEVDFVPRRFASAQHITSLLLLKMRVLVDVTNIRLVRNVVAARLPSELVAQVEQAIIRSPLSSAAFQAKVEQQVKILGSTLVEANHNVVTVLVEPEGSLENLPSSYSHGSPEEAQLVLNSQGDAWTQSGGVLEMLRASCKIAEKDSVDEIDDMMSGSTFKQEPGGDRTSDELLHDVGINRLWGYLGDAVEDAQSVNVHRPSDVKREKLRIWLAEQEAQEEADADDLERFMA